jgi:diguanylate cyclase (GGDEF)-like protein
MFRVLECVWSQHDHLIVAIASAIWCVGSFGFFSILRRSRECGAGRRRQWLAIAAATGGTGVWATHFVAMLAYDGAMPMRFDPGLTILSAVLASLFFWLSLLVLERGRPGGWFGIAGAALVAAGGVAVMHFTGMAAIEAAARVHYDARPVVVGLVLTVICFAAAFAAFSRHQGQRQIVGAALPAIAAVVVLHFTSMSATVLIPDPSLPMPVVGDSRYWLVGTIVGWSSVLMAVTTISALIDRHLSDLRGLSSAALEGLAIVQSGRIVELNAQFSELVGRSCTPPLGEDPDTLLDTVDGQPALTIRDAPVEAALRDIWDHGPVLEIACHDIEYRGRTSQVLAVRDITERKEAQRRIEHMARHDGLTDLPNRSVLDERLDLAIATARRSKEPFALVALDLDRFKAVNDLFGHAEGDRTLRRVADLLKKAVRPSDLVARIGGDEFMILLCGNVCPAGARAFADRMMGLFASHMDMDRDPTAVGISVGIAIHPTDGETGEELKRAADVALYRAKDAGRGTAAFFDRDMDRAEQSRRSLEQDLRQAIARDQLVIVYQPIVRARDGAVCGYEALLRWHHPALGIVRPDVFIPVAEETGAIVEIGEWVLRESCRQASEWPDDLRLAVNVSPIQFRNPDLAARFAAIVAESGFAPGRLELEITETVLLKSEAALQTLNDLRAQGIAIVMDDFGTGYSSLSKLHSFPFDKVKIDRSFVAGLESDAAAQSIVKAIAGLGRSLNMEIVAEGVETPEQHRLIVDAGCSHAQGYLFGRPRLDILPQRRARAA